jgi:hypothetical protein
MEKRNSVDQRRLAVETFLVAHAASLAHQGAIVQSWRRRGRRRLGPYYRLACRDAAGRQRSVYLGPSGPIVDEARDALRRLQSPRRQRREIEGARRALRRELAMSRSELDAELAKVGLKRKGSEIRGWIRGAAAGRGALDTKGQIRRAAATEDT